ncbi:hypothetical protein DICVIV_10102 [Dictyocaulus viviparus]|uniref:Uncharacterized protein n=1 Tax=Dictyocaulus viviparus TaxID=29172 RepID=A0A0D8XGT4_DICVI|nr:hypothetical protein DICVIV_10102 [Dictyocaulus viviparus]
MYMWSALYQMNPWLITSNKISLKAQLQSLPGAGYGMSAAHFLFLQRNKEKDAVTFDEAIQYFVAMNNNYQEQCEAIGQFSTSHGILTTINLDFISVCLCGITEG